jgi:tRNA(Ile)-lysidine synthase
VPPIASSSAPSAKLGRAAALAPAEIAALLAPLQSAAGVILAVSGGVDSVVLMHLWAGLRPCGRAIVATVDHGLRPAAAAEAEAVGQWSRALGFEHRLLRWRGAKPRTRIQEAAREARYRLLFDLAHAVGATHLVTAHQLDDQAETILFRLARGSGPAGLAGMRRVVERDGIIHVRPLLGVPKARLLATAKASNWPFFEDPSNTDPRFLRSRLRQAMPILAGEGLSAERLAVLGSRMARLEEALVAKARQARAHALIEATVGTIVFDPHRLMHEPPAILAAVVATAVGELAADGRAAALRLKRLERLVGELQQAFVGAASLRRTLGGVLVCLERGRLRMSREKSRRRGQVALDAGARAKQPKDPSP